MVHTLLDRFRIINETPQIYFKYIGLYIHRYDLQADCTITDCRRTGGMGVLVTARITNSGPQKLSH